MVSMYKIVLNMAVTLVLVTACIGKKKECISSIGGNDNVEVIDIDKAKENVTVFFHFGRTGCNCVGN